MLGMGTTLVGVLRISLSHEFRLKTHRLVRPNGTRSTLAQVTVMWGNAH